MDAKERKLRIAEAVESLDAQRDPNNPERWVYFADETGTFWSVTPEALLEYTTIRDRLVAEHGRADNEDVYDTWAESDKTSKEIGARLPRAR